MTEDIIVSIQHALDDEKLHDFLIRIANDHLKLPLPLERGYVQMEQDAYGCVFDPATKSLTVRHRSHGWIWGKTVDKAKFTAFFATTRPAQKQPTKGWASE